MVVRDAKRAAILFLRAGWNGLFGPFGPFGPFGHVGPV